MTPPRIDLERLRRVPLFSGCDDDELATIARLADQRTLEADDVLTAEGSSSAELLVVLEGVAEVHRKGEPVATVRAGEVVGELATLDGQRATATVVAATPMTVLAIAGTDAGQLLRLGDVAARLFERVVGWLRSAPTDVTNGSVPAPRRTRRRADDPVAGWDAVTVAEQRVIDLVVAGRSNPHVAAELHISRHTVESHLKSVYAKLGVASRTELAVEAMRRHQEQAAGSA